MNESEFRHNLKGSGVLQQEFRTPFLAVKNTQCHLPVASGGRGHLSPLRESPVGVIHHRQQYLGSAASVNDSVVLVAASNQGWRWVVSLVRRAVQDVHASDSPVYKTTVDLALIVV